MSCTVGCRLRMAPFSWATYASRVPKSVNSAMITGLTALLAIPHRELTFSPALRFSQRYPRDTILALAQMAKSMRRQRSEQKGYVGVSGHVTWRVQCGH